MAMLREWKFFLYTLHTFFNIEMVNKYLQYQKVTQVTNIIVTVTILNENNNDYDNDPQKSAKEIVR